MNTLFIFNSESIDSLICKHIVLALFPNNLDFDFVDIKKSEKFFTPDLVSTTNNNKFIFIGTYPTLTWFNDLLSNPDNTKRIEIYAQNKYDEYISDAFYSTIHIPTSFGLETTLAHKFLNVNYQLITAQNTIISNMQPYNNRELIFNKIHAAIKPLVTTPKFNDAIRLLNPDDNSIIANFLLNDNREIIADNIINVLRNEYMNNLNMSFYTGVDTLINTSYVSILNQNPKIQDNIIKAINYELFEINNVSFLEYVRHIDNKNVQLTYTAVDESITMEPVYTKQFGNVSTDSKTKKLIEYLVTNFNFTYQSFMDMIPDETEDGYKLSFNWDNSIIVEIPIDVYLSIKHAEEV